MAIKLTARGQVVGMNRRVVARVTTRPFADPSGRKDHVLVWREGANALCPTEELRGYEAVLIETAFDDDPMSAAPVPLVHGYGAGNLSHLKDRYIVSIEPDTGFTRTIFRPESSHNTIFATEQCNSNCLMCSQPPKDVDDSDLVEEHLKMISLIDEPPAVMGITGGEPTLLKDDLIRILVALKEQLPNTHVHMLTNGRLYCYPKFVQNIAAVGHPKFTSAVPLYSDTAMHHDYIVQADGAFDQTVEGLYNAATYGLDLEIRVVLHKQTIQRLPNLAEFIYRNFPFVSHIALMGLENMGYVKKNWDLLWIDPVRYSDELQQAVEILYLRRMNVSIYNLPLCLLPKSLWSFSRQSISDFKNIYLAVCEECDAKKHCGGLFLSSKTGHSEHLRPIKLLHS